MRRILFFVLLSIALHLGYWVGIQKLDSQHINNTYLQRNEHNLEVVLVEKKDAPVEQLVRQAELPKELLSPTEPDDKLRFSSEKNQRVKIQTRANLLGMTKNRLYESHQKSRNQYRSPVLNQVTANEPTSHRLSPNTSVQSQTNFPRNSFELSTVGEVLPESVKIGNFTALNTDRHLFYSFYSRVEEAIRQKWEAEVEHTLRNTNRNQYYNPKNTWKTRVDILLTRDGQYFKSELLKSSGIYGLDQAAIAAFKEANFFPHPPKEMVGDDGLIRMQYQFHVLYDPDGRNPTLAN